MIRWAAVAKTVGGMNNIVSIAKVKPEQKRESVRERTEGQAKEDMENSSVIIIILELGLSSWRLDLRGVQDHEI